MSADAALATTDAPRARRVESEDTRRRQLVEATVDAIAEVGFGAATLAEIARRAGVSVGLVAFYFRDKDGLLEATLRHLADLLGRATAVRMRAARTPRERIAAVVDGNLADDQFDRRISTVWLAFWANVPHVPRFRRIQSIYERRMLSNLTHAFRAVLPRDDARRLAAALAALIDGLWLRATLSTDPPDAAEARRIASLFVDAQMALVGTGLLDRRDARLDLEPPARETTP